MRIGYILSENIACKLCWCVLVHSSNIIFGQVRVRSESGSVILVVHVYPLLLGSAVEWERPKFVVSFQVHVCKFAKNGILVNFDSIYDDHVFIIVFEANNTVVYDRENLYRKSIEQDTFRDLNPFCRTFIN